MLDDYNQHVTLRANEGIPAKPLTAEQTQAVVNALIDNASEHHQAFIDLLTRCVPPGLILRQKLKPIFCLRSRVGSTASAGFHPKRPPRCWAQCRAATTSGR
nr:aconitate hydratase 2 [Raoultella sp. NCTC 9187]